MANQNPVQSEKFKSKQFNRLDDTQGKLGDHVFGLRLPVEIQNKLLAKSPKDRVKLMRKAIIEAVNSGGEIKPPSRSQKKHQRNIKRKGKR